MGYRQQAEHNEIGGANTCHGVALYLPAAAFLTTSPGTDLLAGGAVDPVGFYQQVFC